MRHSSSNHSSSGVFVREKLLRHWPLRMLSTFSLSEPVSNTQLPSASFCIQKSLTVVLPLDSISSMTVSSTCVYAARSSSEVRDGSR